MNRALVIWENHPDSVKLFDLTLSDHDYEMACGAHMTMINASTENEHTRWLCDHLEDEVHSVIYDDNVESNQKLTVEYGGVVTIIHSGIVL